MALVGDDAHRRDQRLRAHPARALLTASTLSDHLGRRPVLTGALLAEAAATAVFATAQDVTALIAAPILQGLATGVATSAAGAALLDFEDPDRPGRATLANGITPVAGMAAGVLAATPLVQYAPAFHPHRLPPAAPAVHRAGGRRASPRSSC
ncbi:MFS transporter [Streptomyces cinnamoneus]|uniref:MFS transporter n=1 Tax=Streptomyces cinnamoneus TaxID=53446 RepID=UPI00378F40E9